MGNARTVAVLVGSLRKESFNRKIANALIAAAPESLRFSFVEIGDLPLYNQDLETATPPPAWTTLRSAIRAADALLFVTPEYNRSVPGALKNAIDVGSRPPGKSVWNGKPAAVVSVTQGALGAIAANFALRQSFVTLNVPTMAQLEAFIGKVATLFDDAGTLTDDSTREFLGKFAAAFAQWIDRNAPR